MISVYVHVNRFYSIGGQALVAAWGRRADDGAAFFEGTYLSGIQDESSPVLTDDGTIWPVRHRSGCRLPAPLSWQAA